MKHLRYLSLLLAVVLGLNFTATAQDSRNRVASTIIADGLAQLPAQNLDVLEQVMSEIAGTGAEGTSMLVQYLNESDEGQGAAFEYAIDGLTNYVSAAGRENLRDGVREGLKKGIATAKSNARKAFFVQQLGKIASEAEVPLFEGLLTDSYLKEYALAALTPFGKGKPAAAAATVAKNSAQIAAFREKVAKASAKKQSSLLLRALKNPDRAIRTTALSLADELELKGFDAQVIKAYPKLTTDARADVLRWLGNNRNQSQADVVVGAVSSPDAQLSGAAIEAAGKIGGTQALTALLAALDGPRAADASAALTAFNGDVKHISCAMSQPRGIAAKGCSGQSPARDARWRTPHSRSLSAPDTADWQGWRPLCRCQEPRTNRHRGQLCRPASAL